MEKFKKLEGVTISADDYFAQKMKDPEHRAEYQRQLREEAVDALISKLREARKRIGLTQTDLATRLGVTQGRVGAVESGRKDPGILFLVAYAEAVGAKIDVRFSPVHAVRERSTTKKGYPKKS